MTATMLRLGDPALHFFLTRSVARSLGISLSAALSDGSLSAAGYAELVTRCRTCPNVATCQNWLATAAHDAKAPPDHCLNHTALSTLRPH